jgi:hypothetical protein
MARLFTGAQVLDGAHVRRGGYGKGNWTAKDVWVVYKNPERPGFQSSEIVVVCKRTGRVLYEGSVGDEG